MSEIGPEIPEGISNENADKKALLYSPEEKELFRLITGVEKLGGGKSKSFKVHFEGGGAGVFKPKKSESFLTSIGHGVKKGTWYERERASSLVDRFLGLDLIPPTVIRVVNGKVGSLQEFIPDAREIDMGNKKDQEEFRDDLYKLWILDYILWSTDRNYGNAIIKDKKLHGIDNGLTFGHSKLTVVKTFFDEPAPKELIEKLDNFSKEEKKKRILKDFLDELLPGKHVDACLSRLEYITGLLKEKGTVPPGSMKYRPQEE